MAPVTVRFRISTQNEDWAALRALLTASFAYMEGRIDPPSSLAHWSEATIAREAALGFVILGESPRLIACAFARPDGDALYLGKIAVDAAHRGQGFLHQIIGLAATEAHRAGLTALTLQTRIELTENHAAFAAAGFVKIAETAHPGFDRPTSITMRRAL